LPTVVGLDYRRRTDEQCQSFGDGYTAVKLRFLLFL
jgi:hypothetical protein